MVSVSSKVALAIGITLSVAAISSIFVTMVAAQNLISSSSSSTTSQTQQQQPQPQPQPPQQNATTGGGSTTTATTTTTTPSGTTQIEIPPEASEKPSGQGNYIPESSQESSGASVTWANKDTVAHTATARDGSFDTGIIQPSSSGSATVQGQGKVDYYCTIHPWMTASLTIGGVSTTSGVSGAGATNATSGSNITAQQQQQQQQPPQQQAQDNATTAAPTTAGAGGGFTVRLHPTAFEILPSSNKTDLGTEPEFKDDWITAKHDHFGTRHSLQTTIGKNNVSQLELKWILNSDQPIENPPLIIGDRGYAQDNALKAIAFDVNTGHTLWKYDPGYPASLLA